MLLRPLVAALRFHIRQLGRRDMGAPRGKDVRTNGYAMRALADDMSGSTVATDTLISGCSNQHVTVN